MKLPEWCALLILPFLAGCKGEVASVTVNLNADGSGDCYVGAISDIQHATDAAGNPGGAVQGGTEVQTTDLHLRQTTARFASINDLKVADLTFTLEKQDGKNLLTVRIPASATSKWFSTFGVREESVKLCQRLGAEEKKKSAARRKNDPKAARSPTELPEASTVAFAINLPGKLEGQDFETVPLGAPSKIATDKTERAANLTIPIADVHANKMKEVVWKIRFASP